MLDKISDLKTNKILTQRSAKFQSRIFFHIPRIH